MHPKLDIYFGDNLEVLPTFPDSSFDLIYIDPPFNTGKQQVRTQKRTVRDSAGKHKGFQGKRYRSVDLGTRSFDDHFDDFMAFLEPRIEHAQRLLTPTGSFLLHLDYREVHYAKVLTDSIFGRSSFINEIIWAYDYGARSKKKWPAKHDNILWYAKDPKPYTYRYEHMDRIPYMAPGLVTKEKAKRGKTPTDTWWHTIVSPSGKEKTGYPTQKPLGIVDRIVNIHTEPGDTVLDFFGGSGTLAESAIRQNRNAVMVDSNEESMRVMARRLAFANPTFYGWENPDADASGPSLPDSTLKA